jgi:hypothetical protein
VSQSAEQTASHTGWLVLTTFEEIQTSVSNQELQGDAVIGEASTNGTGFGAKSSTSITVTRLVLRFTKPATSSQPGSNVPPASNSAQPITIPYRDGWFVIQL